MMKVRERILTLSSGHMIASRGSPSNLFSAFIQKNAFIYYGQNNEFITLVNFLSLQNDFICTCETIQNVLARIGTLKLFTLSKPQKAKSRLGSQRLLVEGGSERNDSKFPCPRQQFYRLNLRRFSAPQCDLHETNPRRIIALLFHSNLV